MSEIDTLRELPLWQSAPVITPIAEGRTNRNFEVRDGGRTYFARIGKDLPYHRIDREVERRAMILAAADEIAPPVAYTADGLLVTGFIDGRTLHKHEVQDSDLEGIANVLRRLHRNPASEMPTFLPKEAALFYLEMLPDAALGFDRQQVQSSLVAMPSCEPRCLVHGDLIPENVIAHGTTMHLVDWEYAGRGVPEVDLASVISNFELDDRRASILLNAYGSYAADLLIPMRDASIIREYLWCLVQTRYGETSADLPQYTELCRQRVCGLGL